ncbi:MAG: exo-alpha-sialidase [Gammaproteobacteria bacterium]|nr:exo-alpha-sialidase [Gammaproteobacteria bacterium]
MQLKVATHKGLFTVERRGGWRIAGVDFLGVPCSAALVDARDGTAYAALDHGHFGAKLHRRRRGANAWEEVTVPAYPERAENEPEWQDMHGRVVPNSLSLMWCLEAGHASAPGTLWCGTVPGGLFHSADGGESWSLVRSLWDDPGRRKWFGGGMDYPGIHTVCVDDARPGRVTIAVSCGGVWRSDDAGASWSLIGEGLRAEYMPPEMANDPGIQDVHRLAWCRAHPEVLWVQHHNGIFRSTDDGRHFAELADVAHDGFGFAVAAHPGDADTAWFVPAVKDELRIPRGGELVVLRTRDGGKSFERLTKGLPGEHCYDLCYRHALDVDASGELLAFGSTTGSLWVSEDGGEQWQALSTHLPPINAVRVVAEI